MKVIYNSRVVSSCVTHLESLLPGEAQPLLANINLTENCNARCITCDYWRNTYKNNISTQRAIRLVEELHEAGVENLRFTGGEPLLRKDLFDILAACKPGMFKRITLATNGQLIDRMVDKINESSITNVTVSLDATGDENDRIRGVPGYYDAALANLKKLKKGVKIVSTLSSSLPAHINTLLRICRENGYSYDINLLDRNMYFFSSPEVKKSVESLWPSEADVQAVLDILVRAAIIPPPLAHTAALYYKEREFNFRHCVLGFVEINIDSSGNVRTGCNVYEPVGNITESALADIIKGRAYRTSAIQMYRLNCPLCTCGYGISAVYNRPHAMLGYLLSRISAPKKREAESGKP